MRPNANEKNPSQNDLEKRRLPVFAGLSDRDLVSIYNTARMRQFDKDEWVVAQGTTWKSLGVVVTGTTGLFAQFAGNTVRIDTGGPGYWFGTSKPEHPMPFSVVALERCTVLEFSLTAFRHFPERVRSTVVHGLSDAMINCVAVFKAQGVQTAAEINRLISYIDGRNTRYRNEVLSPFVSGLLKGLPQLPQYATELAVKLLKDDTTIKEVVEGVKQDPSLASLVLKTVNSAHYGLSSSVSDYYHACLLLGFATVYRLVMESQPLIGLP